MPQLKYKPVHQPSPELREKASQLPLNPGVYLYKDSAGQVIYVGKAKNLRNRVRSYFNEDRLADSRTGTLISEAVTVDYILVDNEKEALALENNLIKQYKPRFNVLLRDDKTYPYIKLTNEKYPRVFVTRRLTKGGAYFGPYFPGNLAHRLVDLIRRHFKLASCKLDLSRHYPQPCLEYHIHRCLGPCVQELASGDQYAQAVRDVRLFLEGRTRELAAQLRHRIQEAAEELRFEKAAALRDQIKAMQNIMERQKVIFASDYKDSDVIALARADGEACVQIFFIRGGKLIGREYFILEGTEDTTDNQVMAEFVKQFYTEAAVIPQQVLLPQEIEERIIISQWLRSKRGGEKVELFVPNEGQPRDLVQMAAENATETLQSLKAQWQADAHRQEQALSDLQTHLNLPAPPNRIECYDVSHTQGVATVGAMVVFEQGVPSKKLYRRFNIESTSIGAPDDFASMEEMLTRRFRRWKGSQDAESGPGSKKDAAFSFLPDLIIIDGGKGQLGRAVKVMEEFGLMDVVRVVGLAKQEEEIFFPHKSEPLMLPRHSQGLYLMQRIRDEAHRYGITAHRKKRSKLGLASQLDSIPGIGPARRKALLKHFGSVDKIREASLEELLKVKGVNETSAKNVKAHLE